MIETKELDLLINMELQYFNEDLIKNAFKKIKETYKDSCDYNNGYIIDVIKPLKVINSTFHDELIIIIIKCEILVFKPKIHQLLSDCEIMMIFAHGIFAKYHKLKILIPVTELSDYDFDLQTTTYKHKKNKKKHIHENSKIHIIIKDLKYDENNFNCIGELKILS